MSAKRRKTDLQPMLASPGPERRAALRYPCRSDASCMMVMSHRNESRWARPRDISTTGIGLSVPGSLAPGALALLEFSSRGGQGNLTLLAEVVHSDHQPDGSWAIGCRFDNIRGNLGSAARRQIQTLMRLPASRSRLVPVDPQAIREALSTSCANPLRDLLRALKRRHSTDRERQRRMDVFYDLLLAANDRLHLERREVGLAKMAAHALQSVRNSVHGRLPWLTQDLPSEPMPVLADRARFEWALARVVVVVVQHSGPDAPVSLMATRVGADASLRCGGSATDLDEARLLAIADLVAMAPSATEHVPLSWGDVELALARKTFELHGGHIRVRRDHIALRLPLAGSDS
jgi:PilZ domain